jgi:hypothetical protein
LNHIVCGQQDSYAATSLASKTASVVLFSRNDERHVLAGRSDEHHPGGNAAVCLAGPQCLETKIAQLTHLESSSAPMA